MAGLYSSEKRNVLTPSLPWCHRERSMKVRSFKSLSLFVVFFALACEGGERESEGSTADTTRKRPVRPWTAARTMEVLRRCPLAIAQRLVHRVICCFNCRAWAESQRQCPLHCCWGATRSERSPTFAAQLHLPAHDLFCANSVDGPAPPPCSWSLLG